MHRILDETTCYKMAGVQEIRLLVDADIYYEAFVRAARNARRTILLSGWQFDTKMELLRGQADDRASCPPFLAFLNQLCEQNPALSAHILAWDYSAVYALEREWLQGLKMSWKTHDRVQFEYWTHPNAGGAHHQKFAVVDDVIAFVGGLDICDSRWDERAHPTSSEKRLNVGGKPYKPFHDLQWAVTGAVVKDIRQIFADFWRDVAAPPLPELSQTEREDCATPSLQELIPRGLAIHANRVGISRTHYEGDTNVDASVEALLIRAISAAERHIYLENQYLTSRAILAAFRDRLRAADRPRIDIVAVMPDGADTPKEDFVLGDRQRSVRFALVKLAEEHGHRVRFLISSDRSNPEEPVSTFIHAKLMIVDDRFITVGSANLTNRSMKIDTELNLSVEGAAHGSIREVRASLLAEHAGTARAEDFTDPATMIAQVDRYCDDPGSKLNRLEITRPDDDEPLLIALFDPADQWSAQMIGDALQEEIGWDDGALRAVLRKAGQRMGVVDTE